MQSLEDKVAELHARILVLEQEVSDLKEEDIFQYQWDSAAKTMKWVGGQGK